MSTEDEGTSVADARALLGVGPDATPDDVRRAYLRACKRHRPETDPVGFQRVRAAYDLVSSGVWYPLEGDDEAPDEPPQEAAPDAPPLNRMILEQWARGAFSSAQALLATARRAPTADAGDGIHAPLVRELDLVSETCEAMVSAMAEAILRDDPGPVVEWRRDARGPERDLGRWALARHAPGLRARFGPIVDGPYPFPASQPSPKIPAWGIVVIVLFAVAVGFLTQRPRPDGSRPVMTRTSVTPPSDERRRVCAVSAAACEHYEALASALARGDCAAAHTAWRDLDERVFMYEDGGVRARYLERCAPPATAPPAAAPAPGGR